ncbi:MAG: hypothetical protein AB1297_00245, partial [bacterium]
NDEVPDPSPPVITVAIDHLNNDYVEGIVKKGTGTTTWQLQNQLSHYPKVSYIIPIVCFWGF